MIHYTKWRKKMKKKWSRFLTAIGVTGALTLLNPTAPHNKEPNNEGRKPIKTEKTSLKRDTVKTPIRSVAYFTDTLYQSTSTLMYYVSDKIYRNYVEGNNSFRMQIPYFAHEDWHKHNCYSGFRYKYEYSPMEYYKLCMHDEITANLVAVLSMRYEYLSSKDKEAVIAKYEKTYASFYFKAIKEGKINPESTNPADNEQEWKFLANETKNMWMKLYSEHYSPTTLKMMYAYIQRNGICPSAPKNYKGVKKYMYQIGGVDFDKYIEADIDCPDIKPQIVDKLSKVLSLKNENKDFVEEVVNNIPFLDSIHPNLRGYAMQHILIASKLKTSIAGETDPETVKSIISTQYNKQMFNMSNDVTLKDFISNYSLNELVNNSEIKGKRSYRSLIDEIYTYKGIALNKFISKFSINRVPCVVYFHNTLAQEQAAQINIEDLFIWKDKTLPIDSLHFKETTPASEVAKPRRRLSEELTLAIPNFRDPILTSMTETQREILYQMMQDFENIPAVLKSCNTKEINDYNKKHALKTSFLPQNENSKAR